MEATPREIFYYESADGKVPCRTWLDLVEGQPIYDIVMVRLDRVEHGNLGEHRPVGEGVFELIFDFGPGYRVYFGQDGKDLVILLAGGDKSSQSADIKKAKEYWRDYNA